MDERVVQTTDTWRRGSFRFLAAYATALATAQVLVIALGLAHVTMYRALALAVVVASVGAGWAYSHRLRPGLPLRFEPLRWRFALVLAGGVCVLAGGIYALSWIGALAKPDFSWDGNSYHIPTVHFWVRRGYVHWIDPGYELGSWRIYFVHLFDAYPKGAEAIDFLLVRATGSSDPVNTNNLVFLPLGVAGIVVAARALGATKAAAVACGACFGLVPVVVGQALTSYNDASMADAIAAIVGCMTVVFPELQRDRVPWPAALATGCAIALAVSVKSSGLAPALLAIALIVTTAAWRLARVARAERAAVAREHAAFAGALVAIAFLVSGYWYVRTWVHEGNPLWPVRITAFGHPIFAGPLSVREAISEEPLTPEYMRPWSAWHRIASAWLQDGPRWSQLRSGHPWTCAWMDPKWPCGIRGYDARDGGLGYLWLMACVPSTLAVTASAVIARVRGRDARPLEVLVPMIAIVGVAFLAMPMNWWSRYTVWIYALGLPCLALIVDAVSQWHRSAVVRAALGTWLVLSFAVLSFESVYQFRFSALAGGFPYAPWKVEPSPSGVWHALTWYDHPTALAPNMSALDREVVTRSEPVAFGDIDVLNEPLIGQLSMPLGLRDIVFVSRQLGSDETRLRQLLEAHHVRYLYWRDSRPTPDSVLHLATRQDRVPGFWRVFEVGPPDTHARTDVRIK